MKVKECIEELGKLDPELEMIHQMDSEGNGYVPLGGVEEFWYNPEEGEGLHPDDVEEYKDVAIRAVVVYPGH